MKPNFVTAFLIGYVVYVIGTTERAADGMFPFIGAIMIGPFFTSAVIGIGLLLGRWLKPRFESAWADCQRVRLLCCVATALGFLTLTFASRFDVLSFVEVDVSNPENVIPNSIRLDVAFVSFVLLVWGVLFFPARTAPQPPGAPP